MLAGALLRPYDPDSIAERATGKPGAEAQDVAPEDYEAAGQQLIIEACAPSTSRRCAKRWKP